MKPTAAQLNDLHPRTHEYDRLSAEIHELPVAYDKLIEAKQRIDRPDPKNP